MNIHIIYFSGTGNTAWVVKKLKERLSTLGDEVTATSCEDITPDATMLAACDILGLAFPTHSSFAPVVFRDFIQNLPPAQGMPLFALTTAGYWAGDTTWHTVKPLRAKGYRPFLLGNIIMGNNLHLPLLSPLPVSAPKQMSRRRERAEHKIAQLAAWIHQQKPHRDGLDPFGRLLGIGQRWIADTFESLAFQGFYTDETCKRCGWCVQHCPVQNIEMTKDGIKFLDKCMLCMRCYSFCPEHAIQSTAATKNVKRYRRYAGPEGKGTISI